MSKEKSESGPESGGAGGPGEVKLPSEEELAKLPRRAMIAFAGRCARRVQPLFKHSWPDAPKRHVDAVDRAISLVERSAVSSVSTSDLQDAALAADAAYTDATADAAAYTADSAANAAYAAADAAAYAARAAATAAADAADAYTARAARAVRAAMCRDYQLLKVAAEREQWTDETPVPPEFFSLLWPDVEPRGWPQIVYDESAKSDDLPSEEELAKLPRRAMIAFAGRCARRVQPLYKHFCPDAPKEYWDALDRVVKLVERSAVDHIGTSYLQDATATVTAACDTDPNAYAVADAARAAARVADRSADRTADATRAARAARVARAAADAAARVAAADTATAAVRRDYELLKIAAQRKQWTDETRVRSDFFGPLWPNGEPEGWPVSADHNQNESPAYTDDAPSLSLYFDLDEFSKEEIADFIKQLSALYEEIGGDELIIDDSCVLEFALVPEEV